MFSHIQSISPNMGVCKHLQYSNDKYTELQVYNYDD